MDHAGRFQALCDAINRISNNDWTNTVLYQRLSGEHNIATPRDFLALWLTNTVKKNGKTYMMAPLPYAQREIRAPGLTHRVFTNLLGEYRRELPKEFIQLLDVELSANKINPCWITCYVHDVLPDQTLGGWQNFECSHRCIQYGVNLFNKKSNRGGDEACNDHLCLTWESKSINQSRGNPFCVRACHCPCDMTVCQANNLHIPCCI